MGENAWSADGFPVSWSGSLAIVALPAEIDIGNQREVGEELNALLRMRPDPLIADLTGTRFCDSSGNAVLVRAGQRAKVLGVPFRVAGPREPVLRVMRISGADRVLDLYPTLNAALAGAAGEGPTA